MREERTLRTNYWTKKEIKAQAKAVRENERRKKGREDYFLRPPGGLYKLAQKRLKEQKKGG